MLVVDGGNGYVVEQWVERIEKELGENRSRFMAAKQLKEVLVMGILSKGEFSFSEEAFETLTLGIKNVKKEVLY